MAYYTHKILPPGQPGSEMPRIPQQEPAILLTADGSYATLNPMAPAEEYRIYTDGSSTGNPGPGGWAALIHSRGRPRELAGGFRLTTNNRMELYAAIMGLEQVPEGASVRIISDSTYLVEGITQGWAEKWQAKGWRQTRHKPTPNADLWARLLQAVEKRRVRWEWVRGHVGHPENERADLLAQRAAGAKNLPADEGYENQPAEAVQNQPGLFDGGGSSQEGESPVERRGKVVREGQACRKCGAPVIKKAPERKISAKQKHYYTYYLACPECGTIYLVDEARREVQDQGQPENPGGSGNAADSGNQ